MAEYFPLLERAVAGLTDATPESRRAIYERARNALLGQLRNMDPPVPEEDLARESVALDDAISRLEATFRAPEPAGEETLPPPVFVTPPVAISRPDRLGPLATPRTPVESMPPGLASPGNAPKVAPSSRERAPLAPRAATGASARRPVAPIQTPANPESAESSAAGVARPPRPARPARPLNTAPRVGVEVKPSGALREPSLVVPSPGGEAPPPAVPALPTAPKLDVPVRDGQAPGQPGFGPRPAESEAITEEALASSPVADPVKRKGAAFYLMIVIGVVLAGGVAVEAWKLRDRPEQVLAGQRVSDAEPTGKADQRIAAQNTSSATTQEDSGATAMVPPPFAVGSQAGSTSSAPASADAQPVPLSPAAEESNGLVPSAQTAQAPQQAQTGAEQSQTPTIGVTERAALLVDAPEDPQKVKTYTGFVVWKSESVSGGQGQPLSNAIIADVDIPDAKLTMTMVMKKNMEPQFPASHTIEFRFTDQPGNNVGAVKQINVPEMRLDDSAPTGDPLAGLPVSITDNYFLVGLSRGTAEAANIKMLQSSNWIDVSLLLASGKAAKITFEKGMPGQRIIDDTIKSWQ